MESQRKNVVSDHNGKGGHRRSRSIALCTVLAVILVGCVACLVYHSMKLHEEDARDEAPLPKAVREIPEPEPETEEPTEIDENVYCERVHDFDELREQQNEEIYAWITVPETKVDYPILQTEEDNYYLNRNLDRSSGYPGCIYSNQCNSKEFTDYITVFYGHNMKNKTMFGSLHEFEDEEFFQENTQFQIYTETGRLTYEIYAVVKFTDAYIPAYYDVDTAEGRDSFLDAVRERVPKYSGSYLREEMEIEPEDRLVVLSTCVSGVREQRYLVIGRLEEEAVYYSLANM